MRYTHSYTRTLVHGNTHWTDQTWRTNSRTTWRRFVCVCVCVCVYVFPLSLSRSVRSCFCDISLLPLSLPLSLSPNVFSLSNTHTHTHTHTLSLSLISSHHSHPLQFGTGGGNFRLMFAQFLIQAHTQFGSAVVPHTWTIMASHIGGLWVTLSHILKLIAFAHTHTHTSQAQLSDVLWGKCTELLEQTLREETVLFEDMYTHLCVPLLRSKLWCLFCLYARNTHTGLCVYGVVCVCVWCSLCLSVWHTYVCVRLINTEQSLHLLLFYCY